MRQTLFRIPLDWELALGSGLSVGVFGFGLLLAIWVAVGLFFLYRWRNQPTVAGPEDRWISATIWAVIAAAIIAAPQFKERLPEGIPVFGFGLMMFLGFTSALWLAVQRGPQIGLNADAVYDLGFWLFVTGILGARAFFCIQYADQVFQGPPSVSWLFDFINLSSGGIVFYGCIIGGAVGYAWFCYSRKVSPLDLADLIMPSLAVGVGFGRLGCLMNGCCYGDLCRLPWAITFPRDSVPFLALVSGGFQDFNGPSTPPLHPTQIYSSIDGFLLAALAWWYFPRRSKPGEVLLLVWLLYPLTRFLIEFLRSDESGQLGTSLTISQWISLGLFLAGIIWMMWHQRWQPPAIGKLPLSTAKGVA